MDVETLTEKVHAAVLDDSFTDEFILGKFNKCLGELAAVYTLPELVTHDTVICLVGALTVPLPDNYLKNVHFAVNLTKYNRVEIIDALTTFLDQHPYQDDSPPVNSICIQGKEMYFQGTPTVDETLRIFYVRNPATMEDDGDEPEGLPSTLHEDLLYNYACAECFNLIEEGIDGAKIQFNKYMSLYQHAQIKLETFLGVPPESADFVDYDAVMESNVRS